MLELFTTFMRIGLFTIGGGYAMIPLIQQKVVDEKHWVTQDELVDLIAIAQSSPGVFAANISIFIGYRLKGTPGALFSTLGVCLPSFFIILVIAAFFNQFGDNPVVASIFRGIRPAVVALIATPVFRMARSAKIGFHNAWIPLVCALAIWMLSVSPVYIVIIAGLAGFTYGQLLK